jgi:hypothetical protein
MMNDKTKTMDEKTKTFAEEYRERLSREDLERRWKLEALDHLFSETEYQPEKFRRMWVQPLVNAGLSVDSALSLAVESYFRPN